MKKKESKDAIVRRVRKQLLEKLRVSYGIETIDAMLGSAISDGSCPSICVKCKEFTADYEPDCVEGYCEECETNTVASCLILAGII